MTPVPPTTVAVCVVKRFQMVTGMLKPGVTLLFDERNVASNGALLTMVDVPLVVSMTVFNAAIISAAVSVVMLKPPDCVPVTATN